MLFGPMKRTANIKCEIQGITWFMNSHYNTKAELVLTCFVAKQALYFALCSSLRKIFCKQYMLDIMDMVQMADLADMVDIQDISDVSDIVHITQFFIHFYVNGLKPS